MKQLLSRCSPWFVCLYFGGESFHRKCDCCRLTDLRTSSSFDAGCKHCCNPILPSTAHFRSLTHSTAPPADPDVLFMFIYFLLTQKQQQTPNLCFVFLSQNYKSHDISMAAAALMVNIQTLSPTPRLPCGSELHQVCVGSVGVQFQHLSVPISPVFHFSSALS